MRQSTKREIRKFFKQYAFDIAVGIGIIAAFLALLIIGNLLIHY